MKLLILLILSLLGINNCFSQIQLLSSTKTEATKLAIDNLGNYYLYNHSKIDKYTTNGKLKATYSNNQLGDIESIDVSNPLKNLILHKNQNTLVILDNTLSAEQSNILDLTEANLYNTSAFTYSKIDNGIWFYDQELLQLIKINLNLQRLYQSGNLPEILGLESLLVTELLEQKNKLYMMTTSSILVFDNFGAYYTTIFLGKDAKNLSVENNVLYYFSKTKLKAYNTKTFEEQIIETNIPKEAFAIYCKNKIYTIFNGGFSIYEVKKQ